MARRAGWYWAREFEESLRRDYGCAGGPLSLRYTHGMGPPICGIIETRRFRRQLSFMPSKIPPGGARGWIVPIGGAENKENDRRILERFVRVSGGAAADIVVIPTASQIGRAHV